MNGGFFMKCSQCGSTKFLKKDFLCKAKTLDERETDEGSGVFCEVNKINETAQLFGYQSVVSGDAIGGMRIVGNCDAYICEECGHVELFAKEFVEKAHAKAEADRALAEEKEREEAKLRSDYNNLEEVVLKIKKLIPALQKKIADENITVKEHNEAENELIWIKRNLPDYEEILKQWDRDPKRYQKIWLSIKSNCKFSNLL